ARDPYFIHSRMYADWGFSQLYDRLNHEMAAETQHADSLLRRSLLLDGTPRIRPDGIHPGTTDPEMLEADLKLERHIRASLAK
ncbi:ferritin-like domain-containing protein, partial [Pseudomonas aeruginosa]